MAGVQDKEFVVESLESLKSSLWNELIKSRIVTNSSVDDFLTITITVFKSFIV